MAERQTLSARKVKALSRNKPPRGMVSATINVTYRCNFTCRFCCQLCDVFRQPCSDVTSEQVDRFVADCERLPNLYFVRVSGGEPTLHADFEDIVDYLDERLVKPGIAKYGGVDSNRGEDALKLPKNWAQVSYPNKGRHNVMLVSPDENGMRSKTLGKYCRLACRCGMGFDFGGWSFCLMAPNHQRLLGIERTYDGPTTELDAEVCKHCSWSLSKAEMLWVNQEVAAGRIKWPSEVFKPGLEMLGDQEAIERTLTSLGKVARR